MPESHPCKAVQYSDQKRCDRCNLVWDMNDPEPPDCLTDFEIKRNADMIALKVGEK